MVLHTRTHAHVRSNLIITTRGSATSTDELPKVTAENPTGRPLHKRELLWVERSQGALVSICLTAMKLTCPMLAVETLVMMEDYP